jgi:hypothetical protein
MKNCVLIVGNHRSGTSVISSIVSNLNFFQGKSKDLGKDIHNKDGYFENLEILRFNERVLSSINSKWSDTSVISPQQLSMISSSINTERMKNIIKTDYEMRDKIFIKDPRIVFLFPLYIETLKLLGYNIQIIYANRIINNSCNSLHSVQKIPLEQCYSLYIKHKQITYNMINEYNLPFCIIDYENLINYTSSETEKICKFLNCFSDNLESIVKKDYNRYKIEQEKYYYIHIISYFTGSNRIENLHHHINSIKNKKLSSTKSKQNRLVIVNIRYNTEDEIGSNRFEILRFLEDINTTVKIVYSFNTGGTVKSLWDVYNYCLNEHIVSEYIGCWEDDYCFYEDLWLDKFSSLLQHDNIFVGSLWVEPQFKVENNTKGFKKPINDKRQVPWIREKHVSKEPENPDKLLDYELVKWCEDPYITTFEKLERIKEKLDVFILSPENEIYKHDEHGINYGEVGFCTRLNINGFKFEGIPKDKIIKNL